MTLEFIPAPMLTRLMSLEAPNNLFGILLHLTENPL